MRFKLRPTRCDHTCGKKYRFRHRVRPQFARREAACFQRGREQVEPRILVCRTSLGNNKGCDSGRIHLELSHPLRRHPPDPVAAGVKFLVKLGAVRDNDIASLLFTNHQAAFSFGQVKRYQQTQASIQTVLIALARRGVLGSAVDPLNDIRESAARERAQQSPANVLPV